MPSERLSSLQMLIIGPIAPPQWGPAVKNRIMLDTFVRWHIDIIPINTLLWKVSPFGFLVDLVKKVIKTRRVIVSVSRNGRFVLLPLLSIIGIFCRIHIALLPAGGGFARELDSLPGFIRWLYVRILRHLDLVCVQRMELAEQLRSLGIPMPVVMPNFRKRPTEIPQKFPYQFPQLLFISRIRAVKGVELLLDALDLLFGKGINFSIDFYGIVQPDYKPNFKKTLENRSYASYQGVLDYDEVISAISSYDIMVFPTRWLEEGFPGVLADAAIAGLPVVASDVPSNREIIDNGYNGLLFQSGNPIDLAEKIELLLKNHELRRKMGNNNRVKGRAYDVDVVLRRFLDKLIALGW